jgi:hypothetical protein
MLGRQLLSLRRALDEAGRAGFGGGVSRIIKRTMIAALFAVAMLGGAELPILHAPQFAEAHAIAHEHMHDAAALDPFADAGHHRDDTQKQPGSDHDCTHVHTHCCAATAILAASATAPRAADPGRMRFERNGALPYGQLAHPPLRPPRLTA